MKILGIEITIHKEPIKYDPMRHFKEIIEEKLDKIEKIVRDDSRI